MYSEDEFLMLSGVQHFSFCCRQWALIHVEQKWVENVLTAEGRVEHHRVHDNKITDIRDGKLTIRGLKIHSVKLGVAGECDAVEFTPVNDGITLHGRDGQWSLAPVEYKHGSSKVSDCDRLQVVMQAMCLEEMFSCRIDKAFIFYFETRRREEVDVSIELRRNAEEMLKEMRSYMSRNYTPKVKPSKGCNNCSFKDVCLPELQQEKRQSVSEYINCYVEC